LDCLIVFGDSLSDTGNLSKLTYGVLPGHRYYNGRFSNGKIWIDYMKDLLKIKKVENYAYGAATANNKLTNLISFVPSIHDQVDRFSLNFNESCGIDKKNYLVTYLGGLNDYHNLTLNPFDLVLNMQMDLTRLIEDFEFEQIFVIGLPPASLIPGIILSDPLHYNSFKLKVSVHNTLLSQAVSRLSSLYTNVNLSFFDFGPDFSFLSPWYHNPLPDEQPSYCFDEYEDSEPCTNPEEFFFYDKNHPTTQAHLALAQFGITLIRKNHFAQRCPKPSSFKIFDEYLKL
jgi:phospholipase/lecithinase/hemolysin